MSINDLPQGNAGNRRPSETPAAPAPIIPTPDNGGQIQVPKSPDALMPHGNEGTAGVAR